MFLFRYWNEEANKEFAKRTIQIFPIKVKNNESQINIVSTDLKKRNWFFKLFKSLPFIKTKCVNHINIIENKPIYSVIFFDWKFIHQFNDFEINNGIKILVD